MMTPLLMALMLGISGCASWQPGMSQSGSVMADADSGKPVGDNLNGFLGQSVSSSSLTLQDSPWGANVQVTADVPYYAASGRTCRQLRVSSLESANVRFAVACQAPDGSWRTQRLVTQAQAGRTSR